MVGTDAGSTGSCFTFFSKLKSSSLGKGFNGGITRGAAGSTGSSLHNSFHFCSKLKSSPGEKLHT